MLPAVAALAGCGGSATPAAKPTPASRPSAAAEATPKHHGPELVYVWRNFEVTGIPDEMTVYGNGLVEYRYLLHTRSSISTETMRLRPAQLKTVRGLLGRIDLRHADASSLKPPPGHYRYIVRSGGVTGTAVDGHLHGAMGRLLRMLGADMDRLQTHSL